MISSSDNSSGVMVGAFLCRIEYSGFKSRFIFFSLLALLTSLYFNFFSSRPHTKQEKNCPKTISWMHSRAIQCKQAAYTSILTKVGNGRHLAVRAWAKNIANAWLPIDNLRRDRLAH